jgi:hypothetical protein
MRMEIERGETTDANKTESKSSTVEIYNNGRQKDETTACRYGLH